MTDRIAMYETLAALPLRPGTRLSTEAPAKDEKRAIAYLLEQQLPNGSWPIGDHQQETARAAITALAAKALLAWDSDKEAIKKALAWIDGWMEKTKPEHANSFGAAYILDLQLERYARDKTVKADVQKAVDYLFGGQTPNGAWSYDKRFAIRWRVGFGGWPRTDKGRVHSMNTGPALVYLTMARNKGFKVSAKDLERGREILQKMKQKPAAFTYTYPEPISWEKEEFSIGRAELGKRIGDPSPPKILPARSPFTRTLPRNMVSRWECERVSRRFSRVRCSSSGSSVSPPACGLAKAIA